MRADPEAALQADPNQAGQGTDVLAFRFRQTQPDIVVPEVRTRATRKPALGTEAHDSMEKVPVALTRASTSPWFAAPSATTSSPSGTSQLCCVAPRRSLSSRASPGSSLRSCNSSNSGATFPPRATWPHFPP